MAGLITPRTKRLLVIAAITPLLVLFAAPWLNMQGRHLLAVKEHITSITPEWNEFQSEHPGFQEVRLFAYTGGNGMFGAGGIVATEKQIADLRRFMESTVPPRPVYLNHIRVVGAEDFEVLTGSDSNAPAKGP